MSGAVGKLCGRSNRGTLAANILQPINPKGFAMSDSEFEQGVSETTEAVVKSSRRMTPESMAEVRQIVLRIDEPGA